MATADDTARLTRLLDAARAGNQIAASTQQAVERWLTDPAYAPYRAELVRHIEQGKFRELDDAFWMTLPFGTGGRRGKMYPIGTNVMNDRTVGESAQGLADYLHRALPSGTEPSCVIAHDTRHRSEEFAHLSARALAANGVRVFLFRGFRATPQLSFAVRQLRASAGIVISASHNPPSDNGFKCYWSTGGQVLPPHDAGIIRCVAAVREIRVIALDEGLRDGRIRWLGPDDDEAYVRAVAAQSLSTARSVRLVYTPLHGAGTTSVLPVLGAAGFHDVHIVESQATPDGSFPNVANHSPNPEQPAALREAIELAQAVGADMVLASDPDADRIGLAVPGEGPRSWMTLNGNQIAALVADYIVRRRVAGAGRGSAEAARAAPYILKTLVTTELITRIADAHGVRVRGDLPVGFKWIAAAIDEEGPAGFLLGAEESHGFLTGDYARDKDAAVAALLLAELGAELKAAGGSVREHLDAIYRRYGYHIEQTISKTMAGRAGMERMERVMNTLRTHPPHELGGMQAAELWDYGCGEVRELAGSGSAVAADAAGHHDAIARRAPARPIAGPRVDQLLITLGQPGWRVIARPSGTEPKIKFYLFGVIPPAQSESAAGLVNAKRLAADTLAGVLNDLEAYMAKAVSA